MPDPTETPWPAWLRGMAPERKARAIVRAVARCSAEGRCTDGDTAHAPDLVAHCTPSDAERFLLRLLDGARNPGPASQGQHDWDRRAAERALTAGARPDDADDDEERDPDLHVLDCQDDDCNGECQDGAPF